MTILDNFEAFCFNNFDGNILPSTEMEQSLIIRRTMEVSSILEVSKVLTASFDLEKNLTSAMKILGSQLEMQRGCVYLLDPVSKELRIVAAHGLTKEAIRRGKYQIGEGIVGRVIKSGTPMLIPNIGEEPKFLNKTGSRYNKNGVSFLCIPIILKNETFGVISVDRIYSEEHGGIDDDLRVLTIVSSLVAQFVKLWSNYRKADEEREQLRLQLRERYSLPNLIGESKRFQSVLRIVEKVAGTNATVLLLGESGTGKELVARTIHYHSSRVKGPFVAVNCASLPDNLLEVELFGVEKGAYTGATASRIGRFELADRGTILLDEIGELPLKLQAKLLRVLQEKTFEKIGSSKSIKVNVRVIAATNRNLQEEVRVKNFRDDLYWRLNVLPIMLPSLHEREEDIPLLISFYLNKFNHIYNKKAKLTDNALSVCKRYSWPGNVRELANTIERLVIMAEKDLINSEDLPFNLILQESDLSYGKKPYLPGECNLCSEVESLEREWITRALKDSNFTQSRAAEFLGITPRQLSYKIKKYNIDLNSLK